MRVIDMRLRPPFGGFLDGVLYNAERNRAMTALRGVGMAASLLEKSMTRLLEEMDQAHVVRGVVPMRKTNGGRNEELLELLAAWPDRFIGVPHVDPLEGSAALEEIERYVLQGPCLGIILEPASSFNRENWYLTDERAFPVYEMCRKHDIPVLLTYGGRLVKDQTYLDPLYADRLGALFPGLRLACCHGGWPHVTQMCLAASQRPDIMISADVYMMDFTPGHEAYVTAANYELQDRILFGSSYPIVPIGEAVQRYVKALRPQVLDKVLYQNAARFFRLSEM